MVTQHLQFPWRKTCVPNFVVAVQAGVTPHFLDAQQVTTSQTIDKIQDMELSYEKTIRKMGAALLSIDHKLIGVTSSEK